MGSHGLQDGVGILGVDNDQADSLVGHVERVEAKEFAGRLGRVGNREARLQLDPHPSRGGDLVQGTGDASAGRVAQDVDALGSDGEQGLGQSAQGGRVALQVGLEAEPLANRENHHAVDGDRPADEDHVAGGG